MCVTLTDFKMHEIKNDITECRTRQICNYVKLQKTISY